MKNTLIVTIFAMALGVSAVFHGSFVSYGATVRDFTLYGSFFGGWGFTSATISSPGPTIVVEQGDTVNLTLISSDGITHRFFVSYTNTSSPNTGDPESNDFSSTTNFQFVETTTIGTYKYFCFYHPTMMWGYYQVVQAGTIPEFQPLIMILLLAAITLIPVLVHGRKQHLRAALGKGYTS